MGLVALPMAAMAQSTPKSGRVESDKIESGEGGYRLGCAAMRAKGWSSCEELYEKNQLQKIDEKREQERKARESQSTGGGARRAQ